jgi:hypothetical protein
MHRMLPMLHFFGFRPPLPSVGGRILQNDLLPSVADAFVFSHLQIKVVFGKKN